MSFLNPGHVVVQAQERVLYGQPAEEALLAEVERYDCGRVFVVSTRSLAALVRMADRLGLDGFAAAGPRSA